MISLFSNFEHGIPNLDFNYLKAAARSWTKEQNCLE